ncbi:MAG: Rne/Rng family ribonuclease, partial [Rhodococcus sp. (in: high G+C Gram-positive bacteria)]
TQPTDPTATTQATVTDAVESPVVESPVALVDTAEKTETGGGNDTEEAGTSPGSDDDDQSQPRRRRRGRRGRGRGRGDQSGEDNSGEDNSGEDNSGEDADESTARDTDSDSEDTDSASEGTDSTSEDAESGEDDKPTGERRSRRRSRSRGGAKASDATEDADANATTDSSESESDQDESAAEGSSADASAEDSDDDQDGSDGSSRRRRRRRRRRSSGESSSDGAASEDDPPNTVVHEREPRNKSRGSGSGSGKDEVQGITGSTRLEAKRQRRRDGRDAGRRRPPILTESEFLARRESVDRVMVVREKSLPDHGDTTQVAVLEDGVLVEHFVTSSASASMVGNVYLGRVQNVLPSMEAAFIDIGRGRNGVLYAGEVNWDAAGLGGNSRKIEQALKPGDQVLVQVSKDPVGHKGARLTTQLSLAGRYLVYVPGGSSTGISRKLPDTERKRLKEILRDIVPAEAGVIIRTAAEGVSEEELARDVSRLQSQWATIEEASAKAESGKGSQPQTLYEEPDLLVKVIRDLFNEDFVKLVIEGEKAWTTTSNYIESVAADMLSKLERHEAEPGRPDVFEAHRIDEQLAKALDRKVWLPSGGTLVIDRTEAMTVVDVNTGKFTGSGGNLEETVTRNNLEAAEEVVRQMRLRDIGGMIVVDFIDMVLEQNRDLVLRRLTEALGRDRTRHQVSEVTSLGLVQMTRKKLGTGLVEAFSTTCEHCQGRGIHVHPFPVETKPDDGSRSGPARGESGAPRKRRGRDKSDNVNSTSTVAETHEPVVDPSIKRAHPVALAMAAHHDEVVDDVTPADVVDTMPQDEAPQDGPASDGSGAVEASTRVIDAAEVAAAVGDAEPTPVEEVRTPSRRVRRKASRPTTSPSVEPEPSSAEDSTPGEAAASAEVAPESEPAPEPQPTPEQAAAPEPETAEDVVPVVKARRTRRVARKAAAPTADTPHAAAVFVIPASSDGGGEPEESGPPPVTAPAFAQVDPQVDTPEVEQEVPVGKPRRRRAAARPAGPPVDA